MEQTGSQTMYSQPGMPGYGQANQQPYQQTYQQPYQQPYQKAYQQPYQQPATQQAAPVPPVAAPTYGQTPQSMQAQSPEQLMARQLVTIARSLEQALPAFQFSLSFMGGFAATAQVTLPGADALVALIKDATYFHQAALGTIRRFLTGETTPDLLSTLAVQVARLLKALGQVRPLIENVKAGAPAEMQAPFATLLQIVNGAESMVNQAADAIKAAVGPQIWESAYNAVLEGTAE